jgi:hypothetical protein
LYLWVAVKYNNVGIVNESKISVIPEEPVMSKSRTPDTMIINSKKLPRDFFSTPKPTSSTPNRLKHRGSLPLLDRSLPKLKHKLSHQLELEKCLNFEITFRPFCPAVKWRMPIINCSRESASEKVKPINDSKKQISPQMDKEVPECSYRIK